MTPIRAVAVALLLSMRAQSLASQEPTGRVAVRVEAEGTPLERATVRAASTAAVTNAAGLARLSLPPGTYVVHITLLGYQPDSAAVQIASGRDTLVVVELHAVAAALEQMIVISTRGATRVEAEPTRVEVLGGDDVAEKTEMRPQDLRGFLTEMAGVRLQQTSSATGASGVRLQGLRPRYTLLLADGLPLYGGAGTGLDLLQLPPADLRQIEVIKGPASALYGPSALGGTINLVSKRPGDESDLLLHGSSEGGGNAFGWMSKRRSVAFGYTAVGGAHTQNLRDLDGDGWADLPEVRRVEARPRFFFDAPSGASLFLTAGGTAEDRTGGLMPGRTVGGQQYAERVDTRRGDVGLLGHRVLGAHGLLQARAAANVDRKERRFGTDPEDVTRSTAFTELSASWTSGAHNLLLGGAGEADRARIAQASALDYTFGTLSAFAQDAWSPASRLAFTASARLDDHSRYGAHFSPRLSTLLKLTEEWSLRASATHGFFAPTPFVEETEAVGVRRVVGFDDLRAETADYGALDLGGTAGPFEIALTAFASRVQHAVVAEPSALDATRLHLFNAAAGARARGTEAFVVYDLEPLFITALYSFTASREPDASGAATRPAPYSPRHAGGVDITWEDAEHGTWIALESFYTGEQELEDDPYRTRGKAYTVTGLLATQRVGRYKIFANVENLTDVRQTRYSPLLLPGRTPLGRWTTTPWAPLEGRVFSVGIRVSGGELAHRRP